ncbi:---NA---, partial [Paramuricea clavata]
MTNNCLNDKAQFRYLDSELLNNIETNGTLVYSRNSEYSRRWAVCKGVSSAANNPDYRLKQTNAGSLFLYNMGVCAEPSTKYVAMKPYCDTTEQKFTFGSVTNYGTKMENVHCSPRQHMAIKRADYGDFSKNGAFNDNKNIDMSCSALTNCQVKSRCGGKRSCELFLDNNLLPSPYCSNTSKEIYTEYNCVDSDRSTIITAVPNIRLTGLPYQGYIQVNDGSTWKYVNEKHWDKIRQKMLCQHLGFKETDANPIYIYAWSQRSYNIATGNLICYNIQPSKTSCCIRLVPSTSNPAPGLPYAKC